jgi:hypothetical protein
MTKVLGIIDETAFKKEKNRKEKSDHSYFHLHFFIIIKTKVKEEKGV